MSPNSCRHGWRTSRRAERLGGRRELTRKGSRPNMITLLGLCCILFNVVCVYVAIPDLEGPAPRWLYFSSAPLRVRSDVQRS